MFILSGKDKEEKPLGDRLLWKRSENVTFLRNFLTEIVVVLNVAAWKGND